MNGKFASTCLQLAAASLAIIISPPLCALGLGDAEVHSYMGQPLHARIQLIGLTEGEQGSVTADLASVEDLGKMGLSHTVSVPLHFEISDEIADPFIQVTSRLPVLDPVVQVVVEVLWSGGRMLREYTLFLDPPTVVAAGPAPRVFRAPSIPTGPEVPDPSTISVIESGERSAPARVKSGTDTVAVPGSPVSGEIRPMPATRRAAEPELEVAEEDAVAEERAPRETVTVPAEPTLEEPEPSPVESESPAPDFDVAPDTAEPVREIMPAPVPQSGVDGGTWGPVQRGETLWGIASRFVSGSDYSVNQAMLAIQRLNPDAFGGQNINSLLRGAILQMPTFSEVGSLTRRAAMLEAMRQHYLYLAGRTPPPADQLPTIADSGLVEPTVTSDLPPGETVENAADSDGRLQLVPPSENADIPGVDGAAGATGAVASEEMEETLARTEEELANAHQENAYLNERIRELESQLETAKSKGTVADSSLAEMEQSLREDRLAGDEPLAGEDSEADQARSGGAGWWLGGLLALLVVGAVWLLHRMTRKESATDPGDGASDNPPGPEEPEDKSPEPVEEVKEPEPLPVEVRSPAPPPVNEEEAVELDSADPEVKLDLARAYISMGDPGAARQMLEEVIKGGNEEQVSEAREMMREI